MVFWRKRRTEIKRQIDEQLDQKINQKFDRMESLLERLLERGMTYEVTVENMNVHDPVLESLTFKFDKLDVKEVSGALNLGNNFGVKVEQKEKDKKKREGQKKGIEKSADSSRTSTTQSDGASEVKITDKGPDPSGKLHFRRVDKREEVSDQHSFQKHANGFTFRFDE